VTGLVGCDFFGPIANLPIHGRTFANKFFRLRPMYFLFVRCVFSARVLRVPTRRGRTGGGVVTRQQTTDDRRRMTHFKFFRVRVRVSKIG
jgi:hypothetical protein